MQETGHGATPSVDSASPPSTGRRCSGCAHARARVSVRICSRPSGPVAAVYVPALCLARLTVCVGDHFSLSHCDKQRPGGHLHRNTFGSDKRVSIACAPVNASFEAEITFLINVASCRLALFVYLFNTRQFVQRTIPVDGFPVEKGLCLFPGVARTN